jgi:hypothetical protein
MWLLARLVAVVLAFGLGIGPVEARGDEPASSHSRTSSGTSTKSHSTKSKSSNSSRSKKSSSAKRDKHGRIARSEAAKHEFEAQTGYPHGRRGYVVDHIIPLACGGLDVPSNMQWQTIAAAKAKDKSERAGCR